MKNLNYKELIAYASAFVSFVLPKIDVDEIIFLGSVAREEAVKESDIDLFFNVKTNEEKTKSIIDDELKKFYKSKIHELWELKGIKNAIRAEIGNLDTWKLKRSIISEGILLYGQYKEIPQKTRGFIHFSMTPIKNITKRNKVIRELFGRIEKTYSKEGIVKEMGGKKLSPTSFLVPKEKANEIIKFLSSEKINFSFFEFWTDQIY